MALEPRDLAKADPHFGSNYQTNPFCGGMGNGSPAARKWPNAYTIPLFHQGHGLDLGMDLLTEGQVQAVAGLTGDTGEDKGVRSGLHRGSQAQLDQQSGAFAGAHLMSLAGPAAQMRPSAKTRM
jgi:hypothetical protein